MDVTVPAARGTVTIEAHDAFGRLAWRKVTHNAYTDDAARLHARALAGESGLLTLSHVALGVGGVPICDADTITDWTGATLDTGEFRQGVASIAATAAAGSTQDAVNAATVPAFDASAPDTTIEFWLRVSNRGYVDLAATELRVYSGASYLAVSLSTLEAQLGPIVSGLWRLCSLPTTAFAGAGSWSGVTGLGLHVVADAAGDVVVNVDGVRARADVDVTRAAQTLPYEVVRKGVYDVVLADRVVTVRVMWGVGEAAGEYHHVGLFTNGGATLAAIIASDFYKAADQALTIAWALTTRGS